MSLCVWFLPLRIFPSLFCRWTDNTAPCLTKKDGLASFSPWSSQEITKFLPASELWCTSHRSTRHLMLLIWANHPASVTKVWHGLMMVKDRDGLCVFCTMLWTVALGASSPSVQKGSWPHTPAASGGLQLSISDEITQWGCSFLERTIVKHCMSGVCCTCTSRERDVWSLAPSVICSQTPCSVHFGILCVAPLWTRAPSFPGHSIET